MHNTVMKKKLRPISLSALRGFDAAARLLSFTLAAHELSLTQSSVSRQIKTLEQQVGRALFRRKTRSLELTSAGHLLHETVKAALLEIDATVGDIRGRNQRRRIALTTFASFASTMLMPRLAQFSRIHPDLDIRIEASDLNRDLEAEGVDLAVRFCRIGSEPKDAELLMQEPLIAVVSPAVLARIGPLRSPLDLAKVTLLQEDDGSASAPLKTWERWFEVSGKELPNEVARIFLSLTYQLIEAAIRGQGAALVERAYVRDAIERGELVRAFPIEMKIPYAHYLLRNRERIDTPHVRLFGDWLLAQFRTPAND